LVFFYLIGKDGQAPRFEGVAAVMNILLVTLTFFSQFKFNNRWLDLRSKFGVRLLLLSTKRFIFAEISPQIVLQL
jgi:hypothetical protein